MLIVVGDEAAKLGVHAGRLTSILAEKAEGKGGGKPTLGQAGNLNPKPLDEALSQFERVVKEMLGG